MCPFTTSMSPVFTAHGIDSISEEKGINKKQGKETEIYYETRDK